MMLGDTEKKPYKSQRSLANWDIPPQLWLTLQDQQAHVKLSLQSGMLLES